MAGSSMLLFSLPFTPKPPDEMIFLLLSKQIRHHTEPVKKIDSLISNEEKNRTEGHGFSRHICKHVSGRLQEIRGDLPAPILQEWPPSECLMWVSGTRPAAKAVSCQGPCARPMARCPCGSLPPAPEQGPRGSTKGQLCTRGLAGGCTEVVLTPRCLFTVSGAGVSEGPGAEPL